MADPAAFCARIANYDQDNIQPSKLAEIRKFTYEADFTPENAKNCSVAVAELCRWVISIDQYCSQKGM